MFEHFVYTGKIFSEEDKVPGNNVVVNKAVDGSRDITDQEWAMLGEAWGLGDRLLSVSFKDAVIDAMIAKLADEAPAVPTNLHREVYHYGSEGSLFRQLVVNVAVEYWRCEWFSQKDLLKDAAEEFRDDLICALARKVGGIEGQGNPRKALGCEYHEHRSAGEPCYRTMF